MFSTYIRMALILLSVLSYFFIAASSILSEELKVFFGNLHSHTSFSDGSGTPEKAYKHARDVGKLDFLAITEHNHKLAEGKGDRKDNLLIANDHSLYTGPRRDALIPTANRFTDDGKFVAIYGQEFSTISKGNHVNVFEVPTVIEVDTGKYDELLNTWIPNNLASDGQPAIVQLNHPRNRVSNPNEYGADDFNSLDTWRNNLDSYAELIEIFNGPALVKKLDGKNHDVYVNDYLTYLNLGFHVAPTGNQDNHYLTWGTITDVRTAVIADELTKTKVLDALRSRHVYATEDKNLRVIFYINGKICGDKISPPPSSQKHTDRFCAGCKERGYRKTGVHAPLRHSFATHLLEHGTDSPIHPRAFGAQ